MAFNASGTGSGSYIQLAADAILVLAPAKVDGYKSGVLHGKRTSRENNLVLTEWLGESGRLFFLG